MVVVWAVMFCGDNVECKQHIGGYVKFEDYSSDLGGTQMGNGSIKYIS